MPEVAAAPSSPPKKLFRSDPDLPPAVNGVADVLQDGIEALLKVVDTKVNWVLPNNWVWLPGDYEWHEQTPEGKTPQVTIHYKLTLKDDNSCEYTWQRIEQTKKKTEHSMRMFGEWKQPEKRRVPLSSDSNVDSPVPERGASPVGVTEEGSESRPNTAGSYAAPEPEAAEMRVIDALVIVPQSLGFERNTTGSTGKTVTIATKSQSVDKVGHACLKVASPEEWASSKDAEVAKDEDPVIAPFELLFEVKESGELVRCGGQKAQDFFPPNATSIALAGITAKAVARLGEPHTIITDLWMPDAEMPLPNKHSMPFSPLHWLATYLKTHSPTYEKHVAKQAAIQAELAAIAAEAKADEIAAELAIIAAALALTQKQAHDWLLEKAKFALEKCREEDTDSEEDDN